MSERNIELTVVVMAYNEEQSIAPFLDELRSQLDQVGGPFEILVVDDGSTDRTRSIAESFAASRGETRVIRHETNRGLGGVYRTGFTEARGKLVTFYPADGQFAASWIPLYLDAIKDADLVLGYLPDETRRGPARILSWLERRLYDACFGAMPRFQGILMFRRELLSRFPLVSEGRGWAILMEFILRAARTRCRIRTLPIEMRNRSAGSSKVNNLRTILSNLAQVAKLSIRIRREDPHRTG